MAKSSLEIAQLLVNSGMDVNVTDNEGCAPLHAAAQSGYQEVAELLLGSSASLDARNYDQETPLNLACAIGKLDMAHFLIDQGSDINSWDKDGFIPLHAASRSGHVDVARILLDCGSDILGAFVILIPPSVLSSLTFAEVGLVLWAVLISAPSTYLCQSQASQSSLCSPMGLSSAFSANVDVLLSTTERAWRIAWIAHVESFLGDLVFYAFLQTTSASCIPPYFFYKIPQSYYVPRRIRPARCIRFALRPIKCGLPPRKRIGIPSTTLHGQDVMARVVATPARTWARSTLIEVGSELLERAQLIVVGWTASTYAGLGTSQATFVSPSIAATCCS
ncbi:ankyrin repeat-containing domain protein [Russula aff. rugulosa BPL654]|nr:ankyrin repeat-containing domain protein [Russula aff. rugulosa BPL654]